MMTIIPEAAQTILDSNDSEELDREKFFEWLNTCPSKGDTGWLIVEDEFGRTNVDFFYEDEE